MKNNGHAKKTEVEPLVRYQLNSPVPTVAQIRAAMAARYQLHAADDKIMSPIFQSCAEVAEKILCNILSTDTVFVPRNQMPIRYRYTKRNSKNIGNRRMTGYVCPQCQHKHVRKDDRYCGACGIELVWIGRSGSFLGTWIGDKN